MIQIVNDVIKFIGPLEGHRSVVGKAGDTQQCLTRPEIIPFMDSENNLPLVTTWASSRALWNCHSCMGSVFLNRSKELQEN